MTTNPQQINPQQLAQDSKPVKSVKGPSWEEYEELQFQIHELQGKMNEIIKTVNYHDKWLFDFRISMARLMGHAWYRFIVWIWPIGVGQYRKQPTIRQFYFKDRKPRLPK